MEKKEVRKRTIKEVEEDAKRIPQMTTLELIDFIRELTGLKTEFQKNN